MCYDVYVCAFTGNVIYYSHRDSMFCLFSDILRLWVWSKFVWVFNSLVVMSWR